MPVTFNPNGTIQGPGQAARPGGLTVNVTEPNPLLVNPNGTFEDVPGFLDSDGTSSFFQRIPNPLRLHNSHTYLITLGVLNGEEINNPNLYRGGNGFRQIICRSGGGAYNKRVTTPLEDATGSYGGPDDGFRGSGPAHAEYFIEDLELDAVVAPNTNTGITLGHNLTFSVVEPYSMGKFLESMIIAANDNDFPNYTDAPFCLKVEFVGWDEYGNENANYVQRPVFIPIIISKMDFEVTETGSLYQIQASAYTDSALQNHINQIKTSANVHGSTVHEVLQTGETSFTHVLNDRIEELEERTIIKGYDRFVVVFPTENSNLFSELQGMDTTSSSNGLNVSVDEVNNRPDGTGASTTTVDYTNTSSQIYDYLQTWATDEAKINAIGLSLVRPDPVENTDHHMPEAAEVYDDAILRGMRHISPTEDQREFQARQGTRITDFIENVIIESEWAADKVTEDSDGNGIRDWFRIETKVFIEPSNGNQIELAIGRPRKIYVYAIYEFKTHEARHLNPSQVPKGTEFLKNISKKEYNYIYTGKNEDVLDFNINFNLAYFNSIYSDFGQNQGGRGTDTAHTGLTSATQQSDGGSTTSASDNGEFYPMQEQVIDYGLPNSSGTRLGFVRARKAAIARTFHNRIVNSVVDMINVEMDIWGDPYFLPSDQGNYNAATNTFGLSQDGTMSYLRNEVYVIVNFKTPLDYEIDGYLMTPSEASLNFSGVYQVMSVTNMFKEGKFTQKLGMVRIPGQNDTGSTDNDPTIEETDDRNVDLFEREREGVGPGQIPPSGTPGVGGTGSGSSVTTPVGNTPVQSRAVINGQIVELGFGAGQVDPALAAAVGGSGIGFGAGQVDPALAAAASAAGASGGTGGGGNGIGFGLGQIDPALAAAAAGINGVTPSTQLAFDLGQIDPGLAAAATGTPLGQLVGTVDPGLAAAAASAAGGGSSSNPVTVSQAEIEQLRARRNQIDNRMIEIEGFPGGNIGQPPAAFASEYNSLLAELRNNGRRLIELDALGGVSASFD